jgi:hypothetical protein
MASIFLHPLWEEFTNSDSHPWSGTTYNRADWSDIPAFKATQIQNPVGKYLRLVFFCLFCLDVTGNEDCKQQF